VSRDSAKVLDAPERQRATRALMRRAGILPVVTVETIAQAVAIAQALAKGGLHAVEVTLRSSVAMQALGVVKREVPELLVGAGTVRSAHQANAAREQGADFLVTPATTVELAEVLAAQPLPVIPGAATPTEICTLMDFGFDALKLFPASSLGGLNMVKSLAGPFPDLALCPTGGITEAQVHDYLRQPNVLCIGGSWMVAAEWISAGKFDEVQASARRARELLDSLGAG